MKKTVIFIAAIIMVIFAVNNLLNLNLFSRNCSGCFNWFESFDDCNSYCKSKGKGGCSNVRLVSATCSGAPYYPECNMAFECICTDNSCRIGVYTESCSACLGSGGSGAGFEDIDGDYGNWHDPNWR